MTLVRTLPEQPSGAHPARALGTLNLELLFSAATKPVLFAEAASGCIVEVNPAALSLLRATRGALIGSPLPDLFAVADGPALGSALARARRTGSAPPVIVEARAAGTELTAQLSVVRVPPRAYLLVQLEVAGADDHEDASSSPVLEALDAAPLGFLVVDADLRVEYANRAFIEMLGLGSMDDLRSVRLTRWLEFASRDFMQLSAQMAHRVAVTALRSTVRCESGRMCDVELYAVAVPDEHEPHWAFGVRPRIRLN